MRQAAADGEEADGGEQPRDDGRRQQLDEREARMLAAFGNVLELKKASAGWKSGGR